MESKSQFVVYKGFPSRWLPSPRYCRSNKLLSRCAIEWKPTDEVEEGLFPLVKRLLKLFPFEGLAVEVDQGSCRDVFSDWDSYLEWLRAESDLGNRLFSRIKIFRHTKVLGLLVWEKSPKSGLLELAIYTEQNQISPIAKACESLGEVEIRDYKLRMGFKLFQLFR